MNGLSFQPAIDLIIGPMYAGKTLEVIRRLTIYHEMDMKVLYINSTLDTRTTSTFSTHATSVRSMSQIESDATSTLPFDSVKVSKLSDIDVLAYDVIGIDEGQLFHDLRSQVLMWVEKHKKIVIVAGLNGDFRRNMFGQIVDLVPYCDNIEKLTPFCLPCKRSQQKIQPAHFTKRTVRSDETILIGGKDVYIPVCRECFLNDQV